MIITTDSYVSSYNSYTRIFGALVTRMFLKYQSLEFSDILIGEKFVMLEHLYADGNYL